MMQQNALFKKSVVHMTLRGHCPSKKNLWKRGRGGHVFIDAKVRHLIDGLISQAESQWPDPPCKHPDIHVQFFVRDLRPDRDNKLTTVLDCLRDAGVIKNDNIAQFNGTITLWPAVVDKNERVELVLSYD